MKFEEKLLKIDELVKLINSNTESIEDQIKYFEQGMQLIEECREFLTQAEKKIIDISKSTNAD
jgi:exodeoxyribonuclease VII small subunit